MSRLQRCLVLEPSLRTLPAPAQVRVALPGYSSYKNTAQRPTGSHRAVF